MKLLDFLDDHIMEEDKETIVMVFVCFLLVMFIIVVIMLVIKLGLFLFS